MRERIEEWLRYPLPTIEEEISDSERADEKYKQATAALREATRNRAKFPLVAAENANYGFKRNLWGMKRIGVPVALALVLVSWAMLFATIWGRPWPDPWWGILSKPDSVATIRLFVAIATIGYAALWLFWVKPSLVKDAADTYAKRLMESVQTLARD